jgi:hypothetical protein
MKKIFLLVSAMILAAACSTAPTNHEATPAANANTASEPAAPAMTEAGAIATEKAIWDAIKNKDYAAFGNMLAEDALEVTSDGVYDKAGSIAGIKDFEPSEVALSDWKFLSIDKDAFVVTYSVNVKGKFKGKEIPKEAESGRASSAWVKRGGKWLAIYHQECPLAKGPPPPGAKAAASPAGTPVTTTTGSDPVANEKMVWDFFKTRNYDAFAAVLASDFIEVAPRGVYDKAGSVKSVAEFDASKAVLSDWKMVKLDDDAAVDTYVVKLPGLPGNGERHSSIWARRDGKWIAVLHHGGTPVTTSPVAATSPAAATPKAMAAVPAGTTAPAKKQ